MAKLRHPVLSFCSLVEIMLNIRNTLRFIALAAAVTACEAKKELQGNIELNEASAKILKEKSSKMRKQDILDLLGEPSLVFKYEPNTWYYIHQEIESEAFYDYEVKKNLACVIYFENDGSVKKIELSDKYSDIGMEGKETKQPTYHRDNFIKRMFRNVGRFKPVLPR
ncbi:outer membrane protein assembly factor BamE domain-containing protein [Candidatus Hydrogenosomobacter endosymbioticus]|uniref:Outer membrane protein assembly factor BamE domain-containing protein n=1 Tax=Candidatus Hydrogenosomobacter endosymbioticus TaxID=2558174 RepID=A0ABM7V9Z5_9PROT|nr:outer membrane protein assembly factor BamE [Candidatus Hydrogenosomobacter endosymbioticus]BDB96347.1 hypothetical protein HYD_4800 [Candidatus Hydrogenosomobacter endosymbioticus]